MLRDHTSSLGNLYKDLPCMSSAKQSFPKSVIFIIFITFTENVDFGQLWKAANRSKLPDIIINKLSLHEVDIPRTMKQFLQKFQSSPVWTRKI